MAKISISSLFQGINRSQPAWRRNTGYVEESVNAALETVKGSSKRNGLVYKGKINSTLNEDFVCISVQGIRIFIDADQRVVAVDSNGNNVEVEDETASNFSYLFSNGTINDLDWVVALDTAIVVNTETTVLTETSDDYVIKLEVNTYSELPSSTQNPEEPITNGYYRVLLRENRDPAGYYQYVNGQYVRVSPPNDPSATWVSGTMPHRFVYDAANNRITFSTIPFKDRLSGTSKSNIVMPIENKKILAIDYFQSRLVLLTDETVNLSANSDIYQLFVDDVENIVAQDRISKDILESNIGTPNGTVSLGSSLLITCANSILAFDAANGTELLTTVNGAIRRIADTKCEDIKIFSHGNKVAVVDTNNMIRLVGVTDVAIGPQLLGSLNDYEPKLLRDKTIKQILVDDQELYVLCTDGSLFIHRSEISNGQYVQLAWTEFESNCHTPLFLDSWNNRVRFVCSSTNSSIVLDDWIYSTDLELDPVASGSDTNSDINIHLDSKEISTGTYVSKDDVTYFTHSGDVGSASYSMVVNPTTFVWYKPYRVEANRVYFKGKLSGSWYLGFRFEYRTKLSKLWNGSSTIRLIGSRFTVFHQNTTDYKLTLGRENGTQRSHSFNALRHNKSIIGGTTPRQMENTGYFTSMLVGDTRDTNIIITSDTPGSLTVSSIEFTVNGKGR